MQPLFTKIIQQLFSLTLLSRILGMLRDIVIAQMFGTTVIADILATALRLPHLWRRLFAEGVLALTLTKSLLAFKTTTYLQGQHDNFDLDQIAQINNYFFHRLKVYVFLILFGNITILWLFSTQLASLLAPNLPAHLGLELQHLLNLSLPYFLCVGMAALWMAKLNSENIFWLSASLPIILNLMMLAGLWLSQFLIDSQAAIVVIALVLGGLMQWLVQVGYYNYKFGSQFRYNFTFIWNLLKPKGLDQTQPLSQTYTLKIKQVILEIPLGIFAASSQHLALLIAMIFLSSQDGQVAAQFYAERVLELPLGLIAVCLGQASLPLLTKLAYSKKYTQFARQLSVALHLAILFSIPAALGCKD